VQPPTAAPWAWQNPGLDPVGHPVQSTPAQQASWGGNGPMSSPNNGPAPINIVVQNTNTVASSQPAPPASAPSAVPNATLARPLEPPVGPATLVRVGGRSRSTAIFLSLALGWMGAHRFYLGHSRSGILYLIFCWTYIPLVLSVLSAFKIMGMSREEFDRVYNFAPGWNPTPV
jgi:TM2 domain-containing membrane protein YozV